jgi:putative peptidoglycan lipid II flippase
LSASPPGDRANQLARSAVLLVGLSGAGLVLTIAWNLSVAALFGTSAELDAFWVALAVPRIVADSFHSGILTLLFIAIFAARGDVSETPERWRMASAVLNIVLVVTAVVMVVLAFASSPLVAIMAPGLDVEGAARASGMVRLLSLMLLPTALTGAVAGILNAHQDFFYFGVIRLVGLALQIVALHLLSVRAGADALVASTLLGSYGALVVTLLWRRRIPFRYSPILEFRGPQARTILTMLGALAAIATLTRLNQVSARYFASLLGAGNVSLLEFAWRFDVPVSHIVGMSVALPTFAMMAFHPPEQREAELRPTLAISLRLVALLVIPALGFMLVLRGPLPLLWFGHGAFSAESAAMVSSLLPILVVIFLCNAFATIMVFALVAIRHVRAVLGILVVEAVANVVLNLALAAPFGLHGVLLAMALAEIGTNVWLWSIVFRRVGAGALASALAPGWKTLVANAGAIGLLQLAVAPLSGWLAHDHGIRLALKVIALGIGYLGVYAAICHRLHLIELRTDRGFPRVRLNPREWRVVSVGSE